MDWMQALFLGLVQGLTEFLPISSTAHLRVVPHWLGWEDPGAEFSAVIQLGTLLAVLVYFWKDVQQLVVAVLVGLKNRKPFETAEAQLAWSIAAGTLPIGILGLGFKDWIKTEARALWIIGTALINHHDVPFRDGSFFWQNPLHDPQFPKKGLPADEV